MTKKVHKITLASTRDIPFNRLVLSQANVRTIKTGVSIDELADDIARRGLLQSLYVRPVKGADGKDTGMYEVPAGGRRYRALEQLVKTRRLGKTAPVPCIVKEDGMAEEDSFAENTQREALHPVDQFRAFKTLVDKGLTEEEVAARFFVAPSVVKQRLRLAAVSETLIDAYITEEMTLEQLMAFTVTEDHARQEQVWDSVRQGWNTQPWYIRRALTEGAVSAADRRALFVGLDAYTAAGGIVTRDLFADDEGGWLQDAALLDRLAEQKLKAEAHKLADEGWKWISVAIDFPYGHKQGLRRISGEPVDMTEEEQAARAALVEEYDRLEAEYEGADELPEEIDQRLAEIEDMIDRLDSRPVRYDPDDIPRAGVFVSLDSDGALSCFRRPITDGDKFGASLPRSAPSASWKSPVEMPRRYRTGSSASRLFVRRAHFGRIAEVNTMRSPSAPVASLAPRSRNLTRLTGTGPIPVWIVLSGPCPCRTSRARPSASRSSGIAARKASASASIASASRRRAPSRRTEVSGSSNSSAFHHPPPRPSQPKEPIMAGAGPFHLRADRASTATFADN